MSVCFVWSRVFYCYSLFLSRIPYHFQNTTPVLLYLARHLAGFVKNVGCVSVPICRTVNITLTGPLVVKGSWGLEMYHSKSTWLVTTGYIGDHSALGSRICLYWLSWLNYCIYFSLKRPTFKGRVSGHKKSMSVLLHWNLIGSIQPRKCIWRNCSVVRASHDDDVNRSMHFRSATKHDVRETF